ncbi:F-box protein CPR1-like [Rutidosis leptorrhynchoides]|uniref:F-box protein CPR1-like n=1 Tax=Rutidosis leptorrhynchoides TaxID=125765 RepID=UPI003A9A11F1
MADYLGLPKDLFSDILSQLPSKIIIRCRSVCKSWFTLVSTREFRLLHLKKYNQSNPRFIMRRYDLMDDREMYSVHLDNLALTVDHTIIEFPFSCTPCTNEYLKIIGCIHGVLCLRHEKCNYIEEKIILWNPSIRKNLTISPPKIRKSRMGNLFTALGFQYDKISDDYKVVRVAYNYRYSPRSRQPSRAYHVDIYSIKTAIWRTIPFPPDFNSVYIKGSPVLLNGCVHWIMDRSATCSCRLVTHRSILKFDASAEVFTEIYLPKLLDNETPMHLELALYEERLVLILYRRVKWPGTGASRPIRYIIWALNDYGGNQNSWAVICNMCNDRIEMGRVLQIRDNGKLIMGGRYGPLKELYHNVGYYDSQCGGFIVEDSIYIDKYQESLALWDVGYDVLRDDPRDEGLNE